MSKKQRIKDQISSLKDLIKDLEFQLSEEEDVGKTNDPDFDELLKKIKIGETGGPVKVPYFPKYQCASCGNFVSASEWHMCPGKQYPPGGFNNGWRCGCGAWIGSLQVHTCPNNPGITFYCHGD